MGGGKSYFGVEKAKEAWDRGSIVHDNFKWTQQAEKYAKLHVMLPGEPLLWAKRNAEGHLESGVIVRGSEACPNIVLIDEAYLYFGIHDRIAHANRNRILLEFCAMSRQLGLVIYFISQSAENVDAGVRKIAAFHIHCVNNAKIPGIGAMASLLLGRFTRISKSPQKNVELTREKARFDQSIGDLYNTHGQGDEAVMNTHVGAGVVKPKMDFKFKALGLGIIVAGIAAKMILAKSSEDVHEAADKRMLAAGIAYSGSAGSMGLRVIGWSQDPLLTLVLEDGTTISMAAAEHPPKGMQRRTNGFLVTAADGTETLYPFKK